MPGERSAPSRELQEEKVVSNDFAGTSHSWKIQTANMRSKTVVCNFELIAFKTKLL